MVGRPCTHVRSAHARPNVHPSANPESAKIAAKYDGCVPAEGSVVDHLVGPWSLFVTH